MPRQATKKRSYSNYSKLTQKSNAIAKRKRTDKIQTGYRGSRVAKDRYNESGLDKLSGNPYFKNYVNQMLDPENTRNICRSPMDTFTPSAIYKSRQVKNAAWSDVVGGQRRTLAAIGPSAINGFYSTYGEAETFEVPQVNAAASTDFVDAAVPYMVQTDFPSNQFLSNATLEVRQLNAPLQFAPGFASIPYPSKNGAIYPIRFDTLDAQAPGAGTNAFQVIFKIPSAISHCYEGTVRLYDDTASPITTQPVVSVNNNSNNTAIVTISMTSISEMSNNSENGRTTYDGFISFSYKTAYRVTPPVNVGIFRIANVNVGNKVGGWNHPAFCEVRNVEGIEALGKQTEKILFNATSALFTCAGDQNNNGGTASVGVYPKGASLSGQVGNTSETSYTSLSDRIASTPYNVRTGKLMDGCYAFWAPEDNTDFEYKGLLRNPDDISWILFEGTTGSGTDEPEMLITVTSVLQYLSSSNLNEYQIAPIVPEASLGLQLVNLIERCYCNSRHIKNIKSNMLKTADSIAKQALAYLRRPETLSQIAGYGKKAALGALTALPLLL